MSASRALLHPLVLISITLLVFNDHVLKAAVPGIVTGKLSDFAGMVFFPLLLAATAEQFGVRRGRATLLTATVATAVAFAAIKLWTPAGDIYCVALGALQWPVRAAYAVASGTTLPPLARARLTPDPTDLVALVAVAVPLCLAWRSHDGDANPPGPTTPRSR